jgi:hypothetical protein
MGGGSWWEENDEKRADLTADLGADLTADPEADLGAGLRRA